MTHTAHQSRDLRDYADRAKKVKPNRRRNWLLLTCAVIVLGVVAGYFWRM